MSLPALRILDRRMLAPALTDHIGGTPLVAIEGLDVPSEVRVLGKAEWFNPGGSVKDRAAWGIIRAGLDSGALGTGRTLVDATSGNTGIAYAWIGAALGIPVRLLLPGNAGIERRRILAALGAEVVLTDPMSGTDGAIDAAQRMAAEDPHGLWYPDQYSNDANWRAHYHGTAEEIWEQTGGEVTHLVAGIGTAGTIVGTGRRLRERNPAIEVIGVQPDGPLHVMEGLKHLPSCHVPRIYDARVHQRLVAVSSERAVAMAHAQARHGLLLGWSAGAALAAAEEIARGLDTGVVVAILPDGADRYRSSPLWAEGA